MTPTKRDLCAWQGARKASRRSEALNGEELSGRQSKGHSLAILRPPCTLKFLKDPVQLEEGSEFQRMTDLLSGLQSDTQNPGDPRP